MTPPLFGAASWKSLGLPRRGKLDEEKRLQLLRKGIRCYQFDSRSW